MISRVLIANRGEIALRIVRACREMGIYSVVAYAQPDQDALATQLADEAICIGPALSSNSYLRVDRIIAAAEVCDVDAIHPGYGFLSENAHFAEVCNECKIKFIGPSAEAMRRMGDKAEARKTMQKAKVPVVPGSPGEIKDVDEALEIARNIGYPVMIKASAGGGGKGMRAVHNDASLAKSFRAASNEAEQAFGNPAVYIEKMVVDPRHIEFQILADEHGGVIHVGERDCSLQRRHQKLIEEAPCPVLTRSLRRKMGDAAVRAAKAAGYSNAGTIEFLLGDDNSYYFMEMNTRIQVEHPVTEMISGIDLIKEQIRIASGEKLRWKQENVKLEGHAIEVRINAEDPSRDFAPCPGKITFYCPPGGPGVRIDSHVYNGYRIPPNYDSMVGKLIVHGRDRAEALARCSRALQEYIIEGPGINTTVGFAEFIINREDVIRGDYHTGYLEHVMENVSFEKSRQ